MIRNFVAASLIGLISITSISCQSGESVVSDNGEGKKETVASTAASPGANAAPSTDPATPAESAGQNTASTAPAGVKKEDEFAPQGEQKGNLMGGSGITVTKAKSAPTPDPDPFPARPTPAIVMKDGKIVQPWQAPADAAVVVNPYKNKPDAVKLGRMYYNQKCVDCHGKSGLGNGWMSRGLLRPPTNLASKVVQANTDGELFWKITKGKSPMPAHGVRFDDEQRWYIVSFLRSLKQ
ncbi:MAG: c-type cytochrome [Acidobacteria bacterium]|nr:c-type cytochrome [Acidobacteriota bacterium]